ncbi:MAG TPA: class I SAM-dependent methyltransferase [Vicinamibacterales bacterium]|nr:class I SAM-dependent methyltransferase [Vicinamibacterales bacterium]
MSRSEQNAFVRWAGTLVGAVRVKDGEAPTGIRLFARMALYRVRRRGLRLIDATFGAGSGAKFNAAVLRASSGEDAGSTIMPRDVIERETVESLVTGADEYYKSAIASGATSFLRRKPFHSLDETPQVLVRLGWLLHGARLTPGLQVVEYGGGSGWLSAILWQMGCHVICLDASAAALELARKAFDDRRPLVVWPGARCETALTDGHKLPLPDASADRVICFDVFHHVPNQEEILREFHRVLKPGGLACFSEPGRYHSTTEPSQHEMANFRVLENDIVLEEIWQLARGVGFSRIDIRPMLGDAYSLSLPEYLSLVDAGRVGTRGREGLMAGTVSMSVFFLQKGTFAFDSRHPSSLSASIKAPLALAATVGVPLTLTVVCTNSGRSRWLSRASDEHSLGQVNLALMRCDDGGDTIDRNWRRVSMSRDVDPGESIEISCELVFPNPGSVCLRVDLVSEQVAWFDAVSSPIVITVSLP